MKKLTGPSLGAIQNTLITHATPHEEMIRR